MERARRIGGAFLGADDPHALSRWYAEHLGLEATRAEPHGVVLFAGQPGSTASELSLEVDDLDAMVDQLRAAGVHVDVDESWHPDGRYARLHDPAGNPVQLCQPIDYVRTLEDEPPPERPARRLPARWLALAMGVLIAVVLAVVATQRGEQPEAADDSPATTTTAQPTTTPKSVVTEGRRMLGVTDDWELFAYRPEELIRIELKLGRVTRTPVPALRSSGPAWLIVTPDRAIIRPLDLVAGYAVPDGRPAETLSGKLADGGPAFPGPQPGQLWVHAHEDDHELLSPVTGGGKPAGRSISIPRDFSIVASDHAGNVIADGTGGTYLMRPEGPRRITTGQLLAVGPTRFLTRECDERARCATVVIERRTGSRRTIADHPALAELGMGAIAPDGSQAAMLRTDSDGRLGLHLVDLDTGVDRTFNVRGDSDGNSEPTMAWLPDSRWLFVPSTRRMVAVDAHTGRVLTLGLTLPGVRLVAVRG
jgi:predicted enzyme related to lactoylglutathione lyase